MESGSAAPESDDVTGMKPPPERVVETPYAAVARVSRWRWSVIIRDGMTQYGPDGMPWWVVGTRARALRKARRELVWYMRKIVGPGDMEVVR